MAPTPALLPGKSHAWRSVVGFSPHSRKELDTTSDFTRTCEYGSRSHCIFVKVSLEANVVFFFLFFVKSSLIHWDGGGRHLEGLGLNER